ncbi:MAG: hypothetical protein N4A45_03915 [Flavobacteriales bacterium]|jgi:DNA-directed RNA polymerase specialized sigma subunit|nr:hypothetical protein [Flavobacteriales bacterium]
MKIAKYLKFIEIVWLLFAAFCLVEAIIRFSNGNTQKGWMFLVGLIMGIIMFFLRRKSRKHYENKDSEE